MEGLEMRLSPQRYRQDFSGILTYEPKGNHIDRTHCCLKKWRGRLFWIKQVALISPENFRPKSRIV